MDQQFVAIQISPDAPITPAAPSASAEACVRTITARRIGTYTPYDVQMIVGLYSGLCIEVAIDPVMVLAQVIHETGNLASWWAARPRRNPAGIGVTGRTSPVEPTRGAWVLRDGVWVEGVAFASWADAARAHIGRLLAYALRDEQATPLQRERIGQALAVRPLPTRFRGAASTWRGLNGRWAVPGTTYADKIAAIARRIAREQKEPT